MDSQFKPTVLLNGKLYMSHGYIFKTKDARFLFAPVRIFMYTCVYITIYYLHGAKLSYKHMSNHKLNN